MQRIRLKPKARKVLIIDAAVKIAKSDGIYNVNHNTVSDACEITTGASLVRHYFPTLNDLLVAVSSRDKVLSEKIKRSGLL